MSFLVWPAEEILLSQGVEQRRRHVVLSLIDKFSRAFPEVAYELIWESSTINAQACRLGLARYVRMYGGLVRHPVMTKFGLALTLAHETGHHLGGLPHDPAVPWMTWQGQADYWAAHTAMPLIFGSQARGVTLRGARQILLLHEKLIPLFEGERCPLLGEQRKTSARSEHFRV
jgi:hypothetical protein